MQIIAERLRQKSYALIELLECKYNVLNKPKIKNNLNRTIIECT